MPKELEQLKKTIEEKKPSKEGETPLRATAPVESSQKAFESVDLDQVERIVDKMKKKYSEEGLSFEEVGGNLSELRGIIAEGKQSGVQIQRVEELQEFKNPTVQALGGFYLALRKPLTPIVALWDS